MSTSSAPNSTLLRICSQEVVAYLKLLEICASYILIEREDLLAKEAELKYQQEQEHENSNSNEPSSSSSNSLEIFSKLFSSSSTSSSKPATKKQIFFSKTIEIIRRNNNNNNNRALDDESNEVAFRVYSQEERHRMWLLSSTSQQQQQQTPTTRDGEQNPDQEQETPSNKAVLETLYDHLLNAARLKIMKALPQLLKNTANNNSNNVVIDVSLWPPIEEIEKALTMTKQLGSDSKVPPMEISDFLMNCTSSSSSKNNTNNDNKNSQNENNNNNMTKTSEQLIHTILNKIIENIFIGGNSNNNNNTSNVLSLSEALLIHRLECDAPGVYECTVAKDIVHTIARRRAREMSSVTTTLTLKSKNNNTTNNQDAGDDDTFGLNNDNRLLQENLKTLNKTDRTASGYAYRNYQKKKQQQENNNGSSSSSDEDDEKEIPVTNTTVEYQLLGARSVDVISVNLRADASTLVETWILEKDNYFSNQALKMALRRAFVSFVATKDVVNNFLAKKKKSASSATPQQLQLQLLQNIQQSSTPSLLPPISSIENVLRVCIGSNLNSLASSLSNSNSNSSRKVFVRFGVNVSALNIPDLYILVPKSGFTIKSRLAPFAGQQDHIKKLLNHFTAEESRFAKNLYFHSIVSSILNNNNNNRRSSSSSSSSLWFLNPTQKLKFSSKFGIDVEQAASELKLRFFFPGFFLRDEMTKTTTTSQQQQQVPAPTSTTSTKKSSRNQEIEDIDATSVKEKYDFKSTRHNISLPPTDHTTLFDPITRFYNNSIFFFGSTSTDQQQNEVLEIRTQLLEKLQQLMFGSGGGGSKNQQNQDDTTSASSSIIDETFEVLDFIESSSNAFLKDPNSNNNSNTTHRDETQQQQDLSSIARIIKIKNTPQNFNFVSSLYSMSILHGHRTNGGVDAEEYLSTAFTSIAGSSSASSSNENNNNKNQSSGSNNTATAAGTITSVEDLFFDNKNSSSSAIEGKDQAYQEEVKLNADQNFLQNYLENEKRMREQQQQKLQQQQKAATRLNVPGSSNVANNSSSSSTNAFKREDGDVERIVIRALGQQQHMRLNELMSTINSGIGSNSPNSVPQAQMIRVLRKVAQFEASQGGYRLK